VGSLVSVRGVDALVLQPAVVHPRTPGEVLDLAAALKRENPERTAAQVRRILRATSGWAPSDRTLQRHFERLEPGRETGVASPGQAQVFGGATAMNATGEYTIVDHMEVSTSGAPLSIAPLSALLRMRA
jgi:hypothetical protein